MFTWYKKHLPGELGHSKQKKIKLMLCFGCPSAPICSPASCYLYHVIVKCKRPIVSLSTCMAEKTFSKRFLSGHATITRRTVQWPASCKAAEHPLLHCSFGAWDSRFASLFFFLFSLYMTGQNDRPTESLFRRIVILAGHCPLSGQWPTGVNTIRAHFPSGNLYS